MPSSKLSITKAALYGLLIGLAYSIFIRFSEFDLVPVSYTVGQLIGSAVGGAFLFAVVAAIANLFRK
jgi:hypothetical protein